MLLQHPLQDRPGGGGLGIGGVPQATHQLAGSHLKQLHRRHPLIGSQGNHIPGYISIGESDFLISC